MRWRKATKSKVYALPSSICLMTPMLEKDSPMTLPSRAEILFGSVS